MKYNWQQKDWPRFKYDPSHVEDVIFAFIEENGLVSGLVKGLPENIQLESVIDMMVTEAIKTSEIEGEYLSRQDVVSSIRRNLGLQESYKIKDKKAAGAGKLIVEVRNSYEDPLTTQTLFAWHKMLLQKSTKLNTGMWRSRREPMQVFSGTIGKEKIHFEAPPSKQVPREMKRFIKWFNDTAPGGNNEMKKAPIRSAIAHLYFESIHPFEDGNGRIGRAIAEKALSQTIGRPVLLSLSPSIEADKKSYYAALEKAQQSNEINGWIKYFVNIIYNAQVAAKKMIEFTLKKTKFLDHFKDQLNSRQLKVISKMLDSGIKGFQGGMTAKKYISVTRTSKATATRDLQILTEAGILMPEGGGRSTHYILNI
ncbi:MAG TPA: Fic family protein [Ferruginibacter sp.]|nr:Fic family protein [Ferruginibacter sp.]